MSKGSRQRPVDREKFNEGFDRIFGDIKARKGTQAKPTQVHTDRKKAEKRGYVKHVQRP